MGESENVPLWLRKVSLLIKRDGVVSVTMPDKSVVTIDVYGRVTWDPPQPSTVNGTDELRKALQEAAQSLTTIATLAGKDEYLNDLRQVRGYAQSRANAAQQALAVSTAE